MAVRSLPERGAHLQALSLMFIAVLLSSFSKSLAQLAVQQLIVVPATGSVVIRLSGYDKTTANTKVRQAPSSADSSLPFFLSNL